MYQLKTCTKCKTEKLITEFKNSKRTKDKKTCWCKKCLAEHYNAYRRKIGLTPLGKAKKAWENIQQRCQNKNGVSPEYTNIKLLMSKNEFINWAVPEYDKFMKDNPNVMPSIDRIDPDGHYEINNIRILSISDNCKRSLPIQLMYCIKRCDESEYIDNVVNFITTLCERKNISIDQIIGELDARRCKKTH